MKEKSDCRTRAAGTLSSLSLGTQQDPWGAPASSGTDQQPKQSTGYSQSHILPCSPPPAHRETGSALPSLLQTEARTSGSFTITCPARIWPSGAALLVSHRDSRPVSALPLLTTPYITAWIPVQFQPTLFTSFILPTKS